MIKVSSLVDSPLGRSFLIISDIRGVAAEKVVAVPARRAKTASKSIPLPAKPSVCFPKIALQASEYFCRLLFRTCSIKPKAAASTR